MIKRNLLVIGLAVMLSACGFQLRGTGSTELSVKEMDVSARNAYGPTVVELRKVLERSGVNVHAGAPYHLILTNEQESDRSATYSGGNHTAEYEPDHGAELQHPGPEQSGTDERQAGSTQDLCA